MDCNFYVKEVWNGWARYHGLIYWGTFKTLEGALHGYKIFGIMPCIINTERLEK